MRRRQVLQSAAAGAALSLFSHTTAAQEAEPYAPLGKLDLPKAKEVVVSEDGTTGFLALIDGFATVDLSDPRTPTVLAEERGLLTETDGGPLRGIFDVKVAGETLLVAGPANPTTAENVNALVVYDVSDPANPTQRAVYETDFFHHNVFIEGDYAYLGDNHHQSDEETPRNEVVVVDVRDTPKEVGRWSIVDEDERWADVNVGVWTLHDLYVREGVAYLVFWDAGTWIVDLSDPAAPEYLANVRSPDPGELAQLTEDQLNQMVFEPPGNDHYVTVNDDATVMGVGGESWDINRNDDTGGPSGIELFDISDKTNPEHLAMIAPPATDNATFSGTWTTSHNFDIVGDRLYTSWYQGGVKIHEITDPTEPTELAWWRDPDETSFWTAQLATAGEFFVATSHENPTEGGEERAALYTFPDRAGEQENPPSLTGTPTQTETTAPMQTQTTDVPTTTASTPTSPTETTAPETTTETSGPGFGVPAAIAGLGLGMWRYLKRRE